MSIEHSPARANKNVPRSSARPGGGKRIRGPPPTIFPYDLLTRHEVAHRLRVTPTTITRNYAEWGLKPVRIAGRILFRGDAILALEAKLSDGDEQA